MKSDTKNINKKTLIEEKIANHKFCLFIATLLSLAINVLMIITLAKGELGIKYLIFPIVICTIDLVFIFVTAFTNFKFSYSALYTTVYSLIFIATTVLSALILLNFGKDTAITFIALGLWVGTAVLSLIAIAVGASRAGKNYGAGKAVFSIVLLILCIGAYAYSMLSFGFFGQGDETVERPVSFTYDSEKGYYIATDVISGKGKTAVIPATFNGVKVGAINCNIFLSSNLSTISLMTDADVAFINAGALASGVPDMDILASKETINDFASTIYSLVSDTTVKNQMICELASRLVPSDLSGNEIFVTFSYSPESVLCAEGNFLPVWIGNKNDAFNFEYASNVDYVSYSADSENNLSYLFNSQKFNGGNVLSAVTLPTGESIVGHKLSESVKNVEINFEKIYRVSIADDNDAVYEIEDSFRYLEDGDNYRYITAKTADYLLPTVTLRDGFTLNWKQGNDPVNAISELLTDSLNTYTITPEWTLNAPTVNSFNTLGGKLKYTYGDSLAFYTDVSEPFDGSILSYTWIKNGQIVSDKENYSIDKLLMPDAGTYRLKITASAEEITSLTSSVYKEVNITVNKKTLPIEWLGLDGGTAFTREYNAQESQIDIAYDATSLVFEDDEITYIFNTPTVKNANTYVINISLTDDCAGKYTVSQPSKTYTITKKDIDLEWTVGTYIYNGAVQAPTVSITAGVFDGDEVIAYTSGEQNTGTYTAEAKIKGKENGNYAIKESQRTQNFTITPATLTIAWDNVSQIYQGKDISPIATPEGLKGADKVDDLGLKVTKAKNAGMHDITATITNKNYVLDTDTATVAFEINPATLTLNFNKTTVVYNSKEQKPQFTVEYGLCSSDTFGGLGTSIEGETNVGYYELTVTLTNTNYVIQNPTTGFEITRAPITITWETTTKLIYNGRDQHLNFKAVNGIFTSDREDVTVYVDADISDNRICGSYTSYAVINDETGFGNYYITDGQESKDYTIEQASLTLIWDDLTFTYDKTAKLPTASFKTAPFEDDNVTITITGENTEVGANYTATATIDDTNYKLTNPTAKFVINPMQIEVSWSDTQFVYNGQNQKPTATLVTELCEGDTTTITVSGEKKNAGENYTATASCSNMNYKISNSTQKYTIAKKEIEITWENKEFTYNGQTQYPKASATVASGLITANDNNFTYTGTQKNAGTYTVTAATVNDNYTIKNPTKQYTIAKKEITLSWSTSDLVYNGKTQNPTATASGLVSGESLSFSYSGGQKNAGTGYTVTASTTNTNYKIIDPAKSFNIAQKELTLTWKNTSLVYNGKSQNPTATVAGAASGETVNLTYTGSQKDAGQNYSVTASFNNTNYKIKNPIATFTIAPKTLTVTWSNTNVTYTGNNLKPTAKLNGLVNGETLNVTVKVNGSVNGQKATGTYTATAEISSTNYVLDTATSSVIFTIVAAPAPDKKG